MASNVTVSAQLKQVSNIAILSIGVFSVFTNGILIVITFLDPLKTFQHSSTYFIISLSISDFFTGVASCVYIFTEDISSSEIFEQVVIAPFWASTQYSFVTIFVMAIERLIVITDPLKARYVVTKRRTKRTIAITWFLSLAVGAGTGIPKYGRYVMFLFVIECFLIIFGMILIYIRVLCLLRKADKLFRLKFKNSKKSQVARGESTIAQHNLNTVVFLLAVVLIVTVLPHLLVGQIYLGYQLFNPDSSMPKMVKMLPSVTLPVELLNFAINPVIYAWRLPDYRDALCFYFKRRSVARRGSSLFVTHSLQDQTTRRQYVISNDEHDAI